MKTKPLVLVDSDCRAFRARARESCQHGGDNDVHDVLLHAECARTCV